MPKSIYDAKINNIDFITVTTSASCLVCINSDGQAIYNSLMVSDKRAYKQANEIEKLKEFKKVYKNTKLATYSSLMLPKIYWIKKMNQISLKIRIIFYVQMIILFLNYVVKLQQII